VTGVTRSPGISTGMGGSPGPLPKPMHLTPLIASGRSRTDSAGSSESQRRKIAPSPRVKPLGEREHVVVQVPAAISQRHLIGGRQWLAFLLIGAMVRPAKG
jgi:hypothetical protein